MTRVGYFGTSVGDYISVSQMVTFAPDDTSKVISIPLNDDATYEISESFLGSITLVSDSSQASLTRDSTQVFITDDSDGNFFSHRIPHVGAMGSRPLAGPDA